VYFAEKVLNKGHYCGTMLELRLNITESKILHSYKNNENTKYKVFISNSALLKKPSKLTVICLVKVQKLKHYSFLMLARRTHIIEDKIVLKYEKSENKLDLRYFFNSADRCRGSCYPIGQQIDPWILIPNWPADRCRGSCYPIGQQIGAVIPATQLANR
jgi:hypothetical protein